MAREPLSAHNPRVVHLGRLSSRRRVRESEGLIVVDGPTLLAEALASGLDVIEVFVDDARTEDHFRALCDRAEANGARVCRVTAEVLRRVTDPVHPQGIAAIVRTPVADPALLEDAKAILVLVGVGDPGNAGTLARAALGAGFDALGVTAGTVELFAPKALRASAGASFRLPIVEMGEPSMLVERLEDGGWTIFAASSHDGSPYDEVDLTGRCALLLGNEAHGLSPVIDSQRISMVTIPMAGSTESLNVAMAGTVMCFEALRQRRRGAASERPVSSTVEISCRN